MKLRNQLRNTAESLKTTYDDLAANYPAAMQAIEAFLLTAQSFLIGYVGGYLLGRTLDLAIRLAAKGGRKALTAAKARVGRSTLITAAIIGLPVVLAAGTTYVFVKHTTTGRFVYNLLTMNYDDSTVDEDFDYVDGTDIVIGDDESTDEAPADD